MQEKEKDRTLELIKQQYLGGEKQKKKVMRPTEKFRFNFDWEAADDTSRVSPSLLSVILMRQSDLRDDTALRLLTCACVVVMRQRSTRLT